VGAGGALLRSNKHGDWCLAYALLVPACSGDSLPARPGVRAWESVAAQLLHYAIDYVPSFVLLNPQGEALAKTVRPRSPQHLIDSLHLLVERAQQAADNPGWCHQFFTACWA